MLWIRLFASFSRRKAAITLQMYIIMIMILTMNIVKLECSVGDILTFQSHSRRLTGDTLRLGTKITRKEREMASTDVSRDTPYPLV